MFLQHLSNYWTANNPILTLNEIGVEIDTKQIKVGDGVTVWNALSYLEETPEYVIATGTDTYTTFIYKPTIFGYYAGLKILVKFQNANTIASTINVNSFGAKSIKKDVSVDLVANDVLSGGIYWLFYDGTNFQIQASVGGSLSLNHNLLSVTHPDTLPASVIRGDLITGNSMPKWSRLGIGANGTVLHSDGTDASWQVSALVVPAALTKVDDTNVTLTLGGTPATALLQATSLTLGWTGVLSLARGGTNASLVASNGGIFYSTATAGAILAGTATAGLALISGASTTPSWFTPTLGSVIFADGGGALSQDNTNLFYDNTNKRVGFGTNTPVTPFELINSTAGSYTAITGATTYSSFHHKNTRTSVTQPFFSNDFETDLNFSVNFSAPFTSSQALNAVIAVNAASAVNYSTTIRGATLRADHFGSGTITTLEGGFHLARNNNAGVITNAFGGRFRVDNQTTGTNTTSIAMQAASPSGAAGAIWTTIIGISIQNQTATGTITNPVEALRIDNQTGTNAIAIRQQGTNAHNRFQGNTMIGADATPNASLSVMSNSGTPPTAPAGTVGYFTSGDSVNNSFIIIDAYGSASNTHSDIVFRAARGTSAAPTATQLDDAIGQIQARGYGSTAFPTTGRSNIIFSASENWTDAAQGTYIKFSTTPIGSTTIAERMRIISSGNVGIGTTTPAAPLTVVNALNGVNTFSVTATNTDGFYSAYIQRNTAAGTSRGLLIDAGTNSTDAAMLVRNGAAGSNYFYIRGDGNVGIGTTTPAEVLDVVGNIKLSGNVTTGTWTGVKIGLLYGGTNLDMTATGGTSKFLKQNTLGGAITVTQPATTDLSDVVAPTDYSGTSTIVGWSSFTNKFIRYVTIGKLMYISFYLSGTSNSTSTSFTIPGTSINVASFTQTGVVNSLQDNTVNSTTPGLIAVTANSSTVSLYKDTSPAGTAWTASGTKLVFGCVTVLIQ